MPAWRPDPLWEPHNPGETPPGGPSRNFIRGLGLDRQVRVRHYGDTARIEVAPPDLANFLLEETCDRVALYLKDLGFRFVTLDLEGYRMGSLNQAIE
jgi:uncharacterized protein